MRGTRIYSIHKTRVGPLAGWVYILLYYKVVSSVCYTKDSVCFVAVCKKSVCSGVCNTVYRQSLCVCMWGGNSYTCKAVKVGLDREMGGGGAGRERYAALIQP